MKIERIGEIRITNKDYEEKLLTLLDLHGYNYEIVSSDPDTVITLFSPDFSTSTISTVATSIDLESLVDEYLVKKELELKSEILDVIKDAIDAQEEMEDENGYDEDDDPKHEMSVEEFKNHIKEAYKGTIVEDIVKIGDKFVCPHCKTILGDNVADVEAELLCKSPNTFICKHCGELIYIGDEVF
jgi:hypothetical protein